MPKLNGRPPKYRLHKPTGRAYVEFGGKPIYLGRHDTPESWERYHRLVNEWLASGRVLRPSREHGDRGDARGVQVRELVLAYWRHAKSYYRHPDGKPTSEVNILKQALRLVRHLYGQSDVAAFGPKRLKAVREAMVAKGMVPAAPQQAGLAREVDVPLASRERVGAGGSAPGAARHASPAKGPLRRRS